MNKSRLASFQLEIFNHYLQSDKFIISVRIYTLEIQKLCSLFSGYFYIVVTLGK